MDALSTSAGDEARRAVRISPDTLLRVARADWLSADANTGRGLTTAHQTVAVQLGMSSKTVQRARGLMERLGFAVTVAAGRYLTAVERRAAREHHGGVQLRAASTRALTVPKAAVVENVHLPRRGEALKSSPVKKNSPTRDRARRSTASRPTEAGMKKGGLLADDRRAARPRGIELQIFAAQLVSRMPWLARGRHIGAVCGVLDRAGVDPARWTVGDLSWQFEQFMRRIGGTVPDPSHQRDPLGYLGWMLRASIDSEELTPTERRATANVARRAEQDRWRREEQAQRRRVDADDQEAIDAVIAQMHEDRAADRLRRQRDKARMRVPLAPPQTIR